MRWRVIAVASVGVNVALAAVWVGAPRLLSGRAAASLRSTGQWQSPTSRTNFVVRRQYFSWRDLESPDYEVYIANLRAIGCPEQTVRDIIIADVNALYARRRATELITPEQQWWRSDVDTNVLLAAQEKSRELDDERRALLTRLLGPHWESGDLVSLPRPSRPGLVLDGPILGTLPAETKQALQEINARSEARLQAYLDAQQAQGKSADPVEMAKLRKQTRDELASVLPPGALEEYLLRYSQEANNLRADFGQLEYFDPSPEEFRAMFRATDTIDQQLALLADSTDPNAVQTRQSLQTQRENAIKTALGPARYQEYQLLQDPLYRDAVAAASDAGTPDSVMAIYENNLAAAVGQASIQANTNLTDSQKAIELKNLELQQLQANTVATGQELPPQPPPPAPPPRTYTLRPGDTPAVVAMIYGVPESAIRAANPNVDLSRLRPGDSIFLPGTAMAPQAAPRTPYGP